LRKGLSNRVSNIGTRAILKTFHNIWASSRSLNVNKTLISFESPIPHETSWVFLLEKIEIGTIFIFHRCFPFVFQTIVALRGVCYEKYLSLKMDKGIQVLSLLGVKKSVCFCTFFENQFDHKV